jgi:hypothetical protein
MISFFGPTGNIDLSMIKDEDVAALDDERKTALENFIRAVIERGNATERHADARARVRACMVTEAEALAAHVAANPPPSFLDIHKAAIAAYNASH